MGLSLKKKWISDATREIIGAELAKLTGNEDDKKIAAEIYTQINKELKIIARKNKKQYGKYLAATAQAAEERDDSLPVYRISKVLTGGFTGKTTVVKDKARKVMPTKDIDQRNKKLIG